MGMSLKPGTRLFSTVCDTEMITVQAPDGDLELTIGGEPATISAAVSEDNRAVAAGYDGGSLLGKRYVNDDGTLELLCTKPGDGAAALDGAVLELKEAKALPASD